MSRPMKTKILLRYTKPHRFTGGQFFSLNMCVLYTYKHNIQWRFCIHTDIHIYIHTLLHMSDRELCMCGWSRHSIHLGVRGQFVEVGSLFHYLGSGDSTQVMRLCNKCLNLSCSLLSPHAYTFRLDEMDGKSPISPCYLVLFHLFLIDQRKARNLNSWLKSTICFLSVSGLCQIYLARPKKPQVCFFFSICDVKINHDMYQISMWSA